MSLHAQCISEGPVGLRANSTRPAESDSPQASFKLFAALNEALPKWLCFNGGYRARFEGYAGGDFQDGNTDAYLITRLRLGMAIRPASWFKIYAELQDARASWKTPPVTTAYQSTWDLRRAFADFGDLEKGRLAARVGRQDLNFGYGRLIGTSAWRNVSRGYDAALAVTNFDGVRLSAFSASQVVAGANGLSHSRPGNVVHGLHGSLSKLVPGAVVEPYIFWRLARGFKSEDGAPAKLNEKTVGGRWAGTAGRFDYDAEIAGQTGSLSANSVRAWAWTAITGYTFPSKSRPRIFLRYEFASGDKDPRDGVRNTFDQMFPNTHNRRGAADQVGWQNLKSLGLGLRVSPLRNWMLIGAFNSWWLASATDGFYNSSGSIVARDPSGRSGTHIGNEYDAEASYRLNRHLELGAGVGYIAPGEFLKRTNRGHGYAYPYLMLNYNVL